MTANFRDTYRNNITSFITAEISAVATVIPVTPGTASGFLPTTGNDLVKATLSFGSASIPEVVRVVSVAGNSLTVIRAQESTTAQVWESGAKIEMRLTARMLNDIGYLSEDFRIKIGTEHTDTGFAETIEVGLPGATRAAIVLYNNNIVQAGYNISVEPGVVFGNGVNHTGGDADTVVVGRSITTPADKSVVVGSSITLDSASSGAVVIGRSASSASGTDAVVIGAVAAAAIQSARSVAVGFSTKSLSRDVVVEGSYATVGQGSDQAMALGTFTLVSPNAAGSTVLGVGASSYAPRATALGYYAEAWLDGVLSSTNVPAVQRDQGYYYDSSTAITSTSWPAVIASPPMDLATGGAWVGSVVYKDNEVVKPTSPVGTEQFYLVMGSGVFLDIADTPLDTHPYDGSADVINDITEGAVEPTWSSATGTQGDSVNTAVSSLHKWHYVDPEAGVDLAVAAIAPLAVVSNKVMFYPTRIGFICTEYVTNDVAPSVSVGNQDSATEYASSVALSGITASNEVQWVTVAGNAGATNLVFTLVSKGTGATSRMTGRFVVEGIYVQLPG